MVKKRREIIKHPLILEHGEYKHFIRGYIFEKNKVYVYAPYYPRARRDGYYPLGRLTMEKHLRRFLKPGECVYHKNKDPLDDRVENLEVDFRKNRTGEKNTNWKGGKAKFICEYCKKIYRLYNFEAKERKTRFCSQLCKCKMYIKTHDE